MRDMANKADLSILDEIIKMAEGAMGKGLSKKKPDLAVMEVSMGKGPGPMAGKGAMARHGQAMAESEMNSENGMEDEEQDPESKLEISEGGTSIEVEPEDGNELSDADLQELIAAYKAKKG